MSGIDLSCKLLCAAEAAYCIQTTDPIGKYNPCDNNPNVTPDMIKQYNAVGFVEDPYVITAAQIEACLVGVTKSEIIVSFRGTLPPAKNWDSFFDWLQDFFAVPTTDPYIHGKVHSGFLLALKLLSKNVVKAIKTLQKEHNSPIYITGHSKGGGMAPIAAMYFTNRYKLKIAQTVTFAGPKPGDLYFASYYNRMFTNDLRYENYLDIVPLMPPSTSFIKELELLPLPALLKRMLKSAESWDYEPVGTLKYIDSHGHILSPATPMIIRVADIMYELFTGNIDEIANAHHASCGYRYMQGTCQGTVCC
ncbi:Mbeg1-like protein [uncultured Lacinutrix sp.]|uniref:lipase family protein n=1 Tax=uncultured Lacinutrix sp. TaxID=574032 RepID=UPI00261A85E1|nr:lipase family protein [uncultured Lacinutrix sp.]